MTKPAGWLDEAQRDTVRQWSQRWWWRCELPTWGVLLLCYGGWFALTASWGRLPVWLGYPLLALLGCWYLSLQHELMHGHPTRLPWLNHLLGLAPLVLWYPYAVYRLSHLQHHQDQWLTDPARDPETFYIDPAAWRQYHRLQRRGLAWRQTLPGRLLLGPWLGYLAMWQDQGQRLRRGEWRWLAVWLVHLGLSGLLLWWLAQHGIAWWCYLLAVVWPAHALAMVRSFLEHRAAGPVAHRSVLNEAGWGWRLLFLNLNYHLVHHDLPGLPWFALPRVYRHWRARYQQRSGGFVLDGYLPLLARHLRRMIFHPAPRRSPAGARLKSIGAQHGAGTG